MIDGIPKLGGSASINASMNNSVRLSKPPPIKIKFTEQEDQLLISLVQQHGPKDWIKISKLIETRNPRQCRERWKNYLNPELRKDAWTPEEDKILTEKVAEFGGKWNKIGKFFQNRSDNSIRNRWMLIARRKSKSQEKDNSYSGNMSQSPSVISQGLPGVCVSINGTQKKQEQRPNVEIKMPLPTPKIFIPSYMKPDAQQQSAVHTQNVVTQQNAVNGDYSVEDAFSNDYSSDMSDAVVSEITRTFSTSFDYLDFPQDDFELFGGTNDIWGDFSSSI